MRKLILVIYLVVLTYAGVADGWFEEKKRSLGGSSDRSAGLPFVRVLLDSTGTYTLHKLNAVAEPGDTSYTQITSAFIPFPSTRVFISINDTSAWVSGLKVRWYGLWFDSLADSFKTDLFDSTVVNYAANSITYDVIATATEDSYLYEMVAGVLQQTTSGNEGSTTLEVGVIRSYE